MFSTKTKIFIAVFTVFISCENADNKTADTKTYNDYNYQAVNMHLIDSLGTVSFLIPTRYDTSFQWIEYSDCGKACNKQDYRFQSKKSPIYKESGWISIGKSIKYADNFTISHPSYFPFYSGDSTKDFARHSHFVKILKLDPQNPPVIYDTIQKINDRYYSIIVMERDDTLCSKKIVAQTTIMSNNIQFIYNLVTTHDDSISRNFIKNSLSSIKTIKISKGI